MELIFGVMLWAVIIGLIIVLIRAMPFFACFIIGVLLWVSFTTADASANNKEECDTYAALDKNYKAFPACMELANTGDVEAQYRVGWMMHSGHTVTQNHIKGYKWIRKSAEQGNAKAQHSLGFIYLWGEGVPQNYKEAYIWFSLGVLNGYKGLAEWRDKAANLLSPALIDAQEEATKRFHQILADE